MTIKTKTKSLTQNQKKEKEMFSKKENVWTKYSKTDIKKIFEYSEKYMKFISQSKTERLAVKNIVVILEKAGFKNIEKLNSLKTGDKIYKIIKEKCVISCVVGKEKSFVKIVGSHTDSPRLDLKPNPLYEDCEFALLKTHYYGGIKKYQWVNTPLMLVGVIFTKSGKKIEFSIGDKEDEPKFIIPDLLPHLAKDQMVKDGTKIIDGEGLNVFVGSIPVNDKDIKEKIKFSVLEYLNQKYGIIEDDFNYAEIEVVPANKPTDIGFDRGLIAAYGQDDKVCAFLSLTALIDSNISKSTNIAIFFDKEEIGSIGNSGAVSLIIPDFIEEYKKLTKISESNSEILSKAIAISADVNAGVDPNFKEVNEPRNAAYINKGVAIQKYTGSGGKYSASDANAEYLAYIRNIIEKNEIAAQFCELGKVDLGGGGTIAMYLARYGIEIIDAGPGVLGMHSPYEIVSKADIFECYKLFKSFFEY